MVSETNPEAHHHFSRRRHRLLQRGDPVEVSSTEDGFTRCWFPGSIVDPVEVSSTEDGFTRGWFPGRIVDWSDSKQTDKVIVRYAGTLFTESVDPAFVRPIPPGDDVSCGFEVNDSVDAKVNDGWWVGVVGKVLQGGQGYRVIFDNPPNFVDCAENHLRFHRDWISGNWVRPKKRSETQMLTKGEESFVPGADVEVNLDKETVGDTWLSGVVIRRNSDQTFLVKYQVLISWDDGANVFSIKEDVVDVDLQHIRPIPPCHSGAGYELLDHVDGLIAGRWHNGLITKVTEGKYTVLFKQWNGEKELSISKLRPHLDWDNGEWKSKSNAASKGRVVALSNTEKLDSGNTSADNLQQARVPVSPGASYDNKKEKNPCSSTTRIKMDESTISVEKSASNVSASSSKKIYAISDISGLGAGRMSHSSNSSPSRARDRLNPLGDKKRGSESSGEGSLERTHQKFAASDGRKRANVWKNPAKNAKMDGPMSLETSDTESDGKKMVVKAVTDEGGRQLVPELESTVHEADMSVDGASEGVAEVDQPLLSWLGRFASPNSTHEDRLSAPSVNRCHGSKKRKDEASTNSAPVSTDSDALVLFAKKSPLWAPLEAMDVFRNLPQKPHFLPLKQDEEKVREPAAICIMVTFGNILDEISRMTINNSTCSFEDSLKSLSELESYGFDVSVPRSWIKNLLCMKDLHIRYLTEVENGEKRLDEHVEEDRKSVAVVKELEEKMLALHQLLASAKVDMEAKLARSAVVRAHVDEMKARVGSLRSESERQAQAKRTWRLPG